MLAVLALWVCPTAAYACGACVCDPGQARVVPNFTRNAPTNYRPLLILADGDLIADLRVVDAGGREQDVATSAVGNTGRAHWLSAPAGWSPGTSYRVMLRDQVVGQFEAVDSEDHRAPELSGASLRAGAGRSALCTAVRGAWLDIDHVRDDRFYELVGILNIDGQPVILEILGHDASSYSFGDGMDDPSCLGLAQIKLPEAQALAASLEVFDAASNAARVDNLELVSVGDIGSATCSFEEPPGEPDAGPAQDGGLGLAADGGAEASDADAAHEPPTDSSSPIDFDAASETSVTGCAASPLHAAGLTWLPLLVLIALRRRSQRRSN